jgi:hypothetical protein
MMRVKVAIGATCMGAVAVVAALAGAAAAFTDAGAPCSSARLGATLSGQGESQSTVGVITVTNHETVACRLAGRPTVTMPDGPPHEKLLERSLGASVFPQTVFRRTVLVAARHSESVRFRWTNWCNPGALRSSPAAGSAVEGKRPSRILLRVSPDTQPITAEVRGGVGLLVLPRCLVPSNPASTMFVSLWTTSP